MTDLSGELKNGDTIEPMREDPGRVCQWWTSGECLTKCGMLGEYIVHSRERHEQLVLCAQHAQRVREAFGERQTAETRAVRETTRWPKP